VEDYRVTLEREITEFAAAVLYKPFSRSSLVRELTSSATGGSPSNPKKVRKLESKEA
jgi:hypothetical protein